MLSLLGVVLLAFVQYSFVREVYDLQSREFDRSYKATVEDALYELNTTYGQTGFDSLFYVMDLVGYDWYVQCDTTREENLPATYERVLGEVGSLIQSLEGITPILTYKLMENNQDADLRLGYRIEQLSLLGYGQEPEIVIPLGGNGDAAQREGKSAGLYVNSFVAEGAHYRIKFDFYIDFTHKQQVILRSMRLYFALALGSILVVGILFIVTTRNWIRQKKLSDLKSDFISQITHDLKTPLTTISVASKSLTNQTVLSDPVQVSQLSEVISRQNRYLAERINQVLEVSFMEKSGIHPEWKMVAVNEFLSSLLDDFKRRHEGSGLLLETEIRTGDRQVRADPVLLTTVLNNLLENAVKYSGKPAFIRVVSGWNGGWEISVADRGRGMTPADRKNAFEKFYRGEAAGGGTKGLGLGLYQVKEIVLAHQGKISLDSKPGKGTTISLFIPQN